MSILTFVSCRNYSNEDDSVALFIEMDMTSIRGQLNYVVNPFNEKDSILCLTNIDYIYVRTADVDYYLYLMDVLNKYGIMGSVPSFPGDYYCECRPDSDVICYVIKDGNFVSIMDLDSGEKVQYIQYVTTLLYGYKSIQAQRTIYPYSHGIQNNDGGNFYMDDYVLYSWKDHSNERFVYEMNTSSQTKMLCVEGQFGPIGNRYIYN